MPLRVCSNAPPRSTKRAARPPRSSPRSTTPGANGARVANMSLGRGPPASVAETRRIRREPGHALRHRRRQRRHRHDPPPRITPATTNRRSAPIAGADRKHRSAWRRLDPGRRARELLRDWGPTNGRSGGAGNRRSSAPIPVLEDELRRKLRDRRLRSEMDGCRRRTASRRTNDGAAHLLRDERHARGGGGGELGPRLDPHPGDRNPRRGRRLPARRPPLPSRSAAGR